MDPWLPRALLENVRGSPDAATSLPGTLFWEPKASANALGGECIIKESVIDRLSKSAKPHASRSDVTPKALLFQSLS